MARFVPNALPISLTSPWEPGCSEMGSPRVQRRTSRERGQAPQHFLEISPALAGLGASGFTLLWGTWSRLIMAN